METMILDRNTIKLKLGFCESCVNRIKADIPQRSRAWDPRESVWFIDTRSLDTLIEILRNCTSTEHVALVDLRLLGNLGKEKETTKKRVSNG